MNNIYVGNLEFRTTEEELQAAFEVYGQVDKIAMVRDQDTGQSRGFAFLEMTNEAESEKAIAGLNGSPLPDGSTPGRSLIVHNIY